MFYLKYNTTIEFPVQPIWGQQTKCSYSVQMYLYQCSMWLDRREKSHLSVVIIVKIELLPTIKIEINVYQYIIILKIIVYLWGKVFTMTNEY